ALTAVRPRELKELSADSSEVRVRKRRNHYSDGSQSFRCDVRTEIASRDAPGQPLRSTRADSEVAWQGQVGAIRVGEGMFQSKLARLAQGDHHGGQVGTQRIGNGILAECRDCHVGSDSATERADMS